VEVNKLKACLPQGTQVVRIMPNLAISVGNSMTCLYADQEDREARLRVEELMNRVGTSLAISEELLTPATALCASGLAFFLRSIRAASQGGTEIGFHAEDAIKIAAQTALGAASLLQHSGNHPERCIDKVTTPKGITISGLNEMEHKGFSSSMIRGIVTSANKVAELTEEKVIFRCAAGKE
jgi:pyrroline-5-carboxylate reductase